MADADTDFLEEGDDATEGLSPWDGAPQRDDDEEEDE